MAALTAAPSPPEKLVLRPEYWQQMREHVSALAPEEACGLVGGRGEQVETVIPVPNELHSPVRFRMEPAAQLAAFQELEHAGWDLIGIYHSHPNGPSHPSPTDLEQAYYPEAVMLIWFQVVGKWCCRGFAIQDGTVHEVRLQAADGTASRR